MCHRVFCNHFDVELLGALLVALLKLHFLQQECEREAQAEGELAHLGAF